MIGHYLLALTPDAEDDVLTGKLRPGSYGTETQRCLVGWAADYYLETDEGNGIHRGRRQFENTQWGPTSGNVEVQFDELCSRFGTERIGKAIRNRILTNQARRALTQEAVCSPSVS